MAAKAERLLADIHATLFAITANDRYWRRNSDLQPGRREEAATRADPVWASRRCAQKVRNANPVVEKTG